MSTASTDLFLGRQPILDRTRSIVAYELLDRSAGSPGEAQVADDAEATARVMKQAFQRLDVRNLLGRCRGSSTWMRRRSRAAPSNPCRANRWCSSCWRRWQSTSA